MPVYVGDLLTASAATVTGKPTPTRTWQWLRGSTAISGATSSTYTVAEADVGANLSVRQIETNIAGTASATSTAVGPVELFTVAQLFASGEEGAWYEPSPTTCFTDTAGTTPASVGDPVARINDLSGNGNHATQVTLASRPTLEQTIGGLYYLSFDGTDDGMATASIDFTSTDEMSVFAAATKLSDVRSAIVEYVNTAVQSGVRFEHSGTVFGGNNGSYKSVLRRTSGSGVNDFSGFVTPTDYTGTQTNVLATTASRSGFGNSVVTFRVDGAVPTSNLTNVIGSASCDPSNFSIGNISLGSLVSGSNPLDGNLYGLIVRGASSTTQEISQTEAYLAAKSGVTLP